MISLEAISTAYDAYSRELFAFVMGFVHDPETAEDLLQDLFVKLIRYSQQKHVNDANLRALLYRIARTVCLDHLRSSHQTKVTAVPEDYLSSFADERNDADEAEILRAAIREIIASLEEPARSVFILRNDSGLTFDEVAIALDMSVRTAKTAYG